METHIAEKLHAYTMPRTRPNSRIKDLPDLALLASAGPLNAASLRSAIETTFTFRQTHDVPALVPDPPRTWTVPYAQMAAEDELPWRSLDDVLASARAFLDPVLGDLAMGIWTPTTWTWA